MRSTIELQIDPNEKLNKTDPFVLSDSDSENNGKEEDKNGLNNEYFTYEKTPELPGIYS
jgi:hypothetical protein